MEYRCLLGGYIRSENSSSRLQLVHLLPLLHRPKKKHFTALQTRNNRTKSKSGQSVTLGSTRPLRVPPNQWAGMMVVLVGAVDRGADSNPKFLIHVCTFRICNIAAMSARWSYSAGSSFTRGPWATLRVRDSCGKKTLNVRR